MIPSSHSGLQRQPGGGAALLPHPLPVHDDLPALPLERLHPVLCSHAGGVPLGLLGPQGEPHGRNPVRSGDVLRSWNSESPPSSVHLLSWKPLPSSSSGVMHYYGTFESQDDDLMESLNVMEIVKCNGILKWQTLGINEPLNHGIPPH